VALSEPGIVFEPAISLSYGQGFTVKHYVEAAQAILDMCAKHSGLPKSQIERVLILGLKDMGGLCPPRFIAALTHEIRKKWPNLVIHYHRHYTDGLFVPAVGAAAQAGAQIIDAALGASVRSYGQGDLLATAAYVEEELGLPTRLNREAVRQANFVLKQVMPYYDRYAPTFFRGIDHDVTLHGMPGGATSSSQEGAMKQGYIQFLPHMLRFLAGLRQIVRYHDVTPGSQITWNTSFLAISSAFRLGGPEEVERLMRIIDRAVATPDLEIDRELAQDRLKIYQDCNDAFRDLILGRFGPLPLGFPPDWVYQSAFGDQWAEALATRRSDSPLNHLEDLDLGVEREGLKELIHREPTEEEFVMYLNQPGDALRTIRFRQNFGDPNNLPLDVWFEGLRPGESATFADSQGKPHQITILSVQNKDEKGQVPVRYLLDSEIMLHAAQVGAAPPSPQSKGEGPAASSPYLVTAPVNGDLWVMYVKEGDLVAQGQELFNISIMKQEKGVRSKIAGIVKKIHRTADFQVTKQMVPVRAGDLIVELGPLPLTCQRCHEPLPKEGLKFCPYCGQSLAAG
jgi:pyruvate carboxylase